MLEACAAHGKPEEEVRIECESKRRTHAAAFEINISRPEGRGLLERGTSVEIAHRGERRLSLLAHDLPAAIDPIEIAVHDVYCGVRHRISDRMQRSRKVEIVRIEICEDGAGCSLKTFGNGIRRAVVFLRDPICEMLLVPANDIDGAVFRASVHDNVFEIGISLR